jgi:DNA-binding XRE family transcriptional regulator
MNFSFHPSARTELNQAVDYYNDCEAGLGYDFLQKEYAKILESEGDRTYSVAEVFSEFLGHESQVALRAYRTRENLTQKELSQKTGIPQHQISEMENGKRGIGKERAKKLAEALNVQDYRLFL